MHNVRKQTRTGISKCTQSMSHIGQRLIDSKDVHLYNLLFDASFSKRGQRSDLIQGNSSGYSRNWKAKTIMEPVDVNSFCSNASLRRISKTRLVEVRLPQEVATKIHEGRNCKVTDRVYIGEHIYQKRMSMAYCTTVKRLNRILKMEMKWIKKHLLVCCLLTASSIIVEHIVFNRTAYVCVVD